MNLEWKGVSAGCGRSASSGASSCRSLSPGSGRVAVFTAAARWSKFFRPLIATNSGETRRRSGWQLWSATRHFDQVKRADRVRGRGDAADGFLLALERHFVRGIAATGIRADDGRTSRSPSTICAAGSRRKADRSGGRRSISAKPDGRCYAARLGSRCAKAGCFPLIRSTIRSAPPVPWLIGLMSSDVQ